MKPVLTKKQQIVYDFIYETIKENKIPPTVREICEAIGFKSTATAHAHLENLESKGYIRKNKQKNRAIEIIDEIYDMENVEYVSVPILGKVTAGVPIFATENIEDHFTVPINYANNKELFMLRVQGDSMINAGINHNDLILVEKTNFANNGDIVVALLDDEATVKRFFNEGNYARLQPENEKYEPILSDNVIIQGKVVGLFRHF